MHLKDRTYEYAEPCNNSACGGIVATWKMFRKWVSQRIAAVSNILMLVLKRYRIVDMRSQVRQAFHNCLATLAIEVYKLVLNF